jgi:hypothetical protein
MTVPTAAGQPIPDTASGPQLTGWQPHGDDDRGPDGVVYFKESLGARPFCRDHWEGGP